MTRPRPSRPTLQGKFARKLDSTPEPAAPPALDAAQQAAAISAQFAASLAAPAIDLPIPDHKDGAGVTTNRTGRQGGIRFVSTPSTGRGDDPIPNDTKASVRRSGTQTVGVEPADAVSIRDATVATPQARAHDTGYGGDSLAELKARILGARRTRGPGDARETARTSLRLDAEIFRRLKQLALDEQTTQEKLIEIALVDLYERKAQADG